jgi:hypothetical protein
MHHETQRRQLQSEGVLQGTGVEDINAALRRMEQYWGKQIRFIY